jgi:hypothetical protein
MFKRVITGIDETACAGMITKAAQTVNFTDGGVFIERYTYFDKTEINPSVISNYAKSYQ